MKPSVRSVLAVVAAAPLALAGSIGTAGAATLPGVDIVGWSEVAGGIASAATCEHNSIDELSFEIFALNTDTGAGPEDIDLVRITAAEDESPATAFSSAGVQVSRIIVSYYKNALGLGSPSFSRSVRGAGVADGRLFSTTAMRNVSFIKAKVFWNAITYNDNTAYLHCTMNLTGPPEV